MGKARRCGRLKWFTEGGPSHLHTFLGLGAYAWNGRGSCVWRSRLAGSLAPQILTCLEGERDHPSAGKMYTDPSPSPVGATGLESQWEIPFLLRPVSQFSRGGVLVLSQAFHSPVASQLLVSLGRHVFPLHRGWTRSRSSF